MDGERAGSLECEGSSWRVGCVLGCVVLCFDLSFGFGFAFYILIDVRSAMESIFLVFAFVLYILQGRNLKLGCE